MKMELVITFIHKDVIYTRLLKCQKKKKKENLKRIKKICKEN